MAQRAGRNIQRSRKAKPKRGSDNLLRGHCRAGRGHDDDVTILSQPDRQGGEQRMCEVCGDCCKYCGRDTLVAVGDYVWIVPVGATVGQIERIEDC